jgi:hypothetical protein
MQTSGPSRIAWSFVVVVCAAAVAAPALGAPRQGAGILPPATKLTMSELRGLKAKYNTLQTEVNGLHKIEPQHLNACKKTRAAGSPYARQAWAVEMSVLAKSMLESKNNMKVLAAEAANLADHADAYKTLRDRHALEQGATAMAAGFGTDADAMRQLVNAYLAGAGLDCEAFHEKWVQGVDDWNTGRGQAQRGYNTLLALVKRAR